MAEILIKAVDARQPTITEWTDMLNNRYIPEAQAYPRKLADLQEALANYELVKAGEGGSLTDAQVEEMFWTLKDRDTILYHHNILTVEAVKAPEVKEQELLTKDRRGCYKRGMPVVVMPDAHVWGADEGWPTFMIIKFLGVPVDKVQKYIEPELANQANPESEGYRRRRWHISWDDLPQAVKDKILATGELIIKAGAYNGPYDYTWAQIKGYFKKITTGEAETVDI